MDAPSDDAIRQRLRDRGLAPTAQRMAIYRWLVAHPVHPTIDQIYRALRPNVRSLSRTTVYNVLRAFVGHGLAAKVRTEDAELRYDGRVIPHAHFKCLRCGALSDLADLPADLPNALRLPPGYRPQDLTLTLWGLCPACADAPATGN